VHAALHDEVDLEVLHRRVEELFHDPRQAMDLVHEQHVAGLEAREDAHQIVAALERGAGRALEPAGHFVGEDDRERRLAEAGRPVEEHVVEALAALPRGLHRDAQARHHLALADVLVEALRAERALEGGLVGERRLAEEVVGHADPRRAR
jgi:hypothetical protein